MFCRVRLQCNHPPTIADPLTTFSPPELSFAACLVKALAVNERFFVCFCYRMWRIRQRVSQVVTSVSMCMLLSRHLSPAISVLSMGRSFLKRLTLKLHNVIWPFPKMLLDLCNDCLNQIKGCDEVFTGKLWRKLKCCSVTCLESDSRWSELLVACLGKSTRKEQMPCLQADALPWAQNWHS